MAAGLVKKLWLNGQKRPVYILATLDATMRFGGVDVEDFRSVADPGAPHRRNAGQS